jgi:hypothetical protein
MLPVSASGIVSPRVPIKCAQPRVAIGLGHWTGEARPELSLMAEAAASAGLRYLGVGGSPFFEIGSSAGSTTCSPGMPEPVDWDNAEGTAALVQIDGDDQCVVERLATGSLRFVRSRIDLAATDDRPLGRILDEMSDPSLGLEIVLTGVCPDDTSIDPAALESEFGSRFFSLRIVDRTDLQIEASAELPASQATVVGHFARIMDGRIKSSVDKGEAGIEQEAYRLVMHLLQEGQS